MASVSQPVVKEIILDQSMFFLLRMRHGLMILRVTESLAQPPNVSESHGRKMGSRRGTSVGSATSPHIPTYGWLFSASDMSVCERGRSLHCESLLGNSQEWAKTKVLMANYIGLHRTGQMAQWLRAHIALTDSSLFLMNKMIIPRGFLVREGWRTTASCSYSVCLFPFLSLSLLSPSLFLSPFLLSHPSC